MALVVSILKGETSVAEAVLTCPKTRKVGQRELEEPACDVVFFTQKEDPTMARRRGHTEEQILAALRHAEGGSTVAEIC